MAFEAILLQQRARPSVWRRVTFVVSVALHAVLLTAGVVHSLWQVDELPMPAVEVTLAVAAPPPPPPPPPKRSSSKKKTNPSPKPQALVAPKDVPKEVPEPEPAEEEDEGEEGGVEGGIAGGVVGAPAPPPPKPTGPALLSTKAGHGLIKINPQVAPYKVRVPEQYLREGEQVSPQLQVCVGKDGRVRSARITRPTKPPIDLQVVKVVQTWLYNPHLVNGQATDFCYPLLYTIKN